MLKMEENQRIILLHQSGKSNEKIKLETGHSVNTIKKYLKKEKISKNNLGLSKHKNILGTSFYEPPKYNINNRSKRKLTKEIRSEIEFYLLENEKKRKNGRGKQQKTGLQIHNILVTKGYDIGKSTVYNYIREYLNKSKEAFIKQVYNPGEICEFDWGEVKIFIRGKLQKFNMAVFTSAYSNFRWAILVKRQDTQAFQFVHAEFFKFIKGSYKTIKYDNMKVAVRRFIGPFEKEATSGLLSIATYYGFNFSFCNVRKGNEKGHVEKSVGTIRTAAFGMREDFDNLTEANNYLLEQVEVLNNKANKLKNNLSAYDKFIEEKEFLNEEKPFFETVLMSENRVDKFSTISVYKNRYSVPEEYVSKILDLRIYPNEIVCYYKNNKICSHTRFYTLGGWYINLDHYLKTLKRKPGAFKGSLAFKQANETIKFIYNNYYIGNEKDFIELLNYMKLSNKDSIIIISTIDKLLKLSGKQEITTDKIKMQIDSTKEINKTKVDNNNDFSNYNFMLKGENYVIH